MNFIQRLLHESKQITAFLEARKNPDINPKTNALDTIKKFKDTASTIAGETNGFVHFTKIPKLGINPQSEWTGITPAGIFAYPVDYILNLTSQTGDFSLVPYGSEFQYLYVFSMVGNIVNLDQLSESQANQYINQLQKLVDGSNPRIDRVLNGKYQTPGETLYKIITGVSRIESMKQSSSPHLISRKLFVKLGIDGLIDHSGVMHPGEPVQAVAFSLNNIRSPIRVETYPHSQEKTQRSIKKGEQRKEMIKSASSMQSTLERAINYPEVTIPKISDPATREALITGHPKLITHFTVLSSREAVLAITHADPAKKWQTVLSVISKLKKITEPVAEEIVKNSKPIEIEGAINRILEKKIPVDSKAYSYLLAASFNAARRIPQQLDQTTIARAIELSKQLNPKNTQKIEKLL